MRKEVVANLERNVMVKEYLGNKKSEREPKKTV